MNTETRSNWVKSVAKKGVQNNPSLQITLEYGEFIQCESTTTIL
jgi:hypothetical protein